MSWLKYGRYALPVVLGGLGILLLVRVFVSDTMILIPEDIDIVLLVSLLGVTMAAAIHTLVRISMQYLRVRTVRQVRRETMAEHTRFLRRLDHELKNPLTTLRAGLSTLSLTTIDAQQQSLIETMQIETLRLSRLVADLRKLANLEVQPLDLQPVDLEAFSGNIIQIERDRFEAGHRILTSQLDTPQAVWVADQDLLALAVHNLLDNAFKYTQPADTVTLEISAQNELIIQVSDTGRGIPQPAQRHIWEELYRVEPVEKVAGSGIGLALVKAIVERHDGYVTIESDPQQGTTITLHLPPISKA